MGKVLVTRWKGSVRGNFPVLGAIRIDMKGTDNNNNASVTGKLELEGSKSEWKGVGNPEIGNDYGGTTSYAVTFTKTDKGLLLVKDKYNIKKISSTYTYGANVNFEDINKYCKNLSILYLANSEQEGDLSEIADLNVLETISLNCSKVTGNINVLSCLPNLKSLNIGDSKSIECDLQDLSSCYNLEELKIERSNTTGNLSSLATCLKLKSIASTGSGIKGSISSLANLESFIYFSNFTLPNTWSSDSLRPSRMEKIMGNIKFATSTDTDNFIKNMAECTVGNTKKWYFQNSHRTPASDAAVQKLQQQGYTLEQLIKD